MYCPECGSRLECFDGEPYCPDCTRYEIEREAARALDEAVRLRRAEAEWAAAGEGPADGGPPF
jgi:uncharacterized Zn finger protein (UPF0148 family)